MKKFMLLAIVAMFATINVFAEDNQKTTTTQENDSFITCQFSLNHYSGKTYGGNANGYGAGKTNSVVVYLNCPQPEDVYATVFVYIDGNCVTSKVIKVPANKTESEGVQISTGIPNAQYTLKV